MAGNVYEWCADWYGASYYQNSPELNPKGPDTGTYRVLRGGSWFNNTDYLRCANRDYSNPSVRNDDIGFRCVRNTVPSEKTGSP